ncbi:hypothetical protein V8C86DRAFT_507619 [Haematococcus lacustris]
MTAARLGVNLLLRLLLPLLLLVCRLVMMRREGVQRVASSSPPTHPWRSTCPTDQPTRSNGPTGGAPLTAAYASQPWPCPWAMANARARQDTAWTGFLGVHALTPASTPGSLTWAPHAPPVEFRSMGHALSQALGRLVSWCVRWSATRCQSLSGAPVLPRLPANQLSASCPSPVLLASCRLRMAGRRLKGAGIQTLPLSMSMPGPVLHGWKPVCFLGRRCALSVASERLLLRTTDMIGCT